MSTELYPPSESGYIAIILSFKDHGLEIEWVMAVDFWFLGIKSTLVVELFELDSKFYTFFWTRFFFPK